MQFRKINSKLWNVGTKRIIQKFFKQFDMK